MHGPWDKDRLDGGQRPFDVPVDCQEQQRCFLFSDSEIASLRLAAFTYAFPVLHADNVEELVSNQDVLYDSDSVLQVPGIGSYYGPVAMGEYKAILKPSVNRGMFDGEITFMESVKYEHIGKSMDVLRLQYLYKEMWGHEQTAKERKWRTLINFRPCSIVTDFSTVTWEQETLESFMQSSRQPGKISEVCQIVQQHCIGVNKQFNSTEACTEYLTSLPEQDVKCQDQYGGFSAKGETRLCKYLHHFMIPFSPGLHCFHSGPVLGPDAGGNFKCSPRDCDSNFSSAHMQKMVAPKEEVVLEKCSEKLRVQLEQRTLLALPSCLAALNMGVCSDNCSQAVNTFLIPLVHKLCDCVTEHPVPISSILRILKVDARSILSVCMYHASAKHAIMGLQPMCVEMGIPKSDRCPYPDTYVSLSGCSAWDWDVFEDSYLRELTPEGMEERFREDSISRASLAAKVQVSYFDFRFYLGIWTLHLGGINANFFRRLASRLGESFPLTPNTKMHLSHAHVVAALANPAQKRRSTVGWRWLPSWPKLVTEHLLVSQTTGSSMHTSWRAFFWAAVPRLAATFAQVQISSAFVLEGTSREDIRKALSGEIVRQLLNAEEDLGLPDVQMLIPLILEPRDFHGSFGDTVSTALRTQMKRARKILKQLFGEDAIRKLGNAHGLHAVSVDELLDGVVSLIFISAGGSLLHTGAEMVLFIRKDPCRLVPLWKEDPISFSREFARLHGIPKWFQHAGENGEMHVENTEAANRDPAVFSDGDTFNPRRQDLNKAILFNALEEDVLTGASKTTHRVCLGRNFSLAFLNAIIPHFFPDVECHDGEEVFEGVLFKKELVDTTRGKLEVRKVVEEEDIASNLVLFLHGLPDIPQVWVKMIKELRKRMPMPAFDSRWDTWALTLPQWEEVALQDHFICDLEHTAEMIMEFLHMAKRTYTMVVLVGHDVGAVLAFVVGHLVYDNKEGVLSGLVAIGAPHPVAFDGYLANLPLTRAYMLPFLSPLWSALFGKDDYAVLRNLYEGEVGFTTVMTSAWQRAWERLGPDRIACYYQHNLRFSYPFNIRAWSWHKEAYRYDKMVSDIPTLILWGNRDQYLGYPQLYNTSALLFPRSKVIMVDKATHFSLLWDDVEKTSEEVSEFLFGLVAERISLMSQFNPLDIPQVIGWIFCLILLLSGYSMELFVSRYIDILFSELDIEAENEFAKLAERVDFFYRLSKMAFPLFVSISVLSHTWLGAPLYVLGMWKFGFPEAMTYARLACLSETSLKSRTINGLTAFAMIMHHIGSTILYSHLVVGAIHMDRGILFVGICLVAIHMACNLFEVKALALIGLILALSCEALMQMESISYVHLSKFPVNLSVWFLLSSHWIIFALAIWTVFLKRRLLGSFHKQDSMRSNSSQPEEEIKNHRTLKSLAQAAAYLDHSMDLGQVGAAGQNRNYAHGTNHVLGFVAAKRKSVHLRDSMGGDLFPQHDRNSVFPRLRSTLRSSSASRRTTLRQSGTSEESTRIGDASGHSTLRQSGGLSEARVSEARFSWKPIDSILQEEVSETFVKLDRTDDAQFTDQDFIVAPPIFEETEMQFTGQDLVVAPPIFKKSEMRPSQLARRMDDGSTSKSAHHIIMI